MDPITAFTSQVPFLSAAIVLLRCLSVVPILNLKTACTAQTFKFNNYKNNFYSALAVLSCGNYVVSQVATSGSAISWIAFAAGIAAVAVFEFAICAPNSEDYSVVAKRQFSVDDMLPIIAEKLSRLRKYLSDDHYHGYVEFVEGQKKYKEMVHPQELIKSEQDYESREQAEKHSCQEIILTVQGEIPDIYIDNLIVHENELIGPSGELKDLAVKIDSVKDECKKQVSDIQDYSLTDETAVKVDLLEQKRQNFEATVVENINEQNKEIGKIRRELSSMGKKFENIKKNQHREFTKMKDIVANHEAKYGRLIIDGKKCKPEDLAKMSAGHLSELDPFYNLAGKTTTIRWNHMNINRSPSKIELAIFIIQSSNYDIYSKNNKVIAAIANYYFEIVKDGKQLHFESIDIHKAKKKLRRNAEIMGKKEITH